MKKKSDEIQQINSHSTKKKAVEYTIRIGNHLYQKIDKHIRLLKHLKNDSSKQKWVQEAIREKLKIDEISHEQLGDRFLHLKFDVDLWLEIQKRIDMLKAFHTSISKKQWIEEAVYEKLDRDEKNSQELLKDMLKNASKTSHSTST